MRDLATPSAYPAVRLGRRSTMAGPDHIPETQPSQPKRQSSEETPNSPPTPSPARTPTVEPILRKREVPVWTEAQYLEFTRALRPTYLALGAFGVANLASNGLQKLVLKVMERAQERSFEREVRALSKVRGIDGVQQIEGVVLEGEDYVIASRYAGATLGQCVEQKLLSREQLEDALE